MPIAASDFYDRARAAGRPGPIACVGVDPGAATLARWGLPDTADGALAFGRAMLDAAAGRAVVVKPQAAYFERFGAHGYAALTSLLAEARERGFAVIVDAKRGDIDATMAAYGAGWLGPKAPMRADAVTVTPYLGFGALEPLIAQAADCGAYVFVVARSSNPEGAAVQTVGEPTVWLRLLDEIADWSARHSARTVGAVVGATVPAELGQALAALPEALFLAPGIGAQGASVADLKARGLELDRVLVSSSRGLAAAGPDPAALAQAVATFAGAAP